MFVPLYAFGINPSGDNDRMHFYISRPRDLQNPENNKSKDTGAPSLVKNGLRFATSSHPTDRLSDALAAQTVFTMQEVVKYRRYVSLAAIWD